MSPWRVTEWTTSCPTLHVESAASTGRPRLLSSAAKATRMILSTRSMRPSTARQRPRASMMVTRFASSVSRSNTAVSTNTRSIRPLPCTIHCSTLRRMHPSQDHARTSRRRSCFPIRSGPTLSSSMTTPAALQAVCRAAPTRASTRTARLMSAATSQGAVRSARWSRRRAHRCSWWRHHLDACDTTVIPLLHHHRRQPWRCSTVQRWHRQSHSVRFGTRSRLTMHRGCLRYPCRKQACGRSANAGIRRATSPSCVPNALAPRCVASSRVEHARCPSRTIRRVSRPSPHVPAPRSSTPRDT